jgi:predicted porin
MGKVTLGAAYATSKNERVAGEATVKGYDLGAKYDLSKRTNVAFHYQSVDNRAGTTVGTTSDNSKFRMRVMHSF